MVYSLRGNGVVGQGDVCLMVVGNWGSVVGEGMGVGELWFDGWGFRI